jgi:hypothetical protein
MQKNMIICLLGAMMLTGCAMYDSVIRKQPVESKITVFARSKHGEVKGIEIKKTEGGFYIGPDGKVFYKEPTAKDLGRLYCK